MPHIVIRQHLSIHYKEDNLSGSPAVILLHGLGVTGDLWMLHIPALSKAGFCIITPDIRSLGKSDYLD